MILDKENENITKSLLKKAMGYSIDEVVEEYANVENELKLIKKKITKKHIPPDINAAKAILEKFYDSDFESIRTLSDDELYDMRDNLLKEISKQKGGKL